MFIKMFNHQIKRNINKRIKKRIYRSGNNIKIKTIIKKCERIIIMIISKIPPVIKPIKNTDNYCYRTKKQQQQKILKQTIFKNIKKHQNILSLSNIYHNQ